MRKREDLKVGDKVIAIYHEGCGNSGHGYEVEITKITKDYITVKKLDENRHAFGTTMEFTNDERMCHRSLIYSNYQHCNLFLGTVEEAKKADDQRVESWELFIKAYNLLEREGDTLPPKVLEQIVKLIEDNKKCTGK